MCMAGSRAGEGFLPSLSIFETEVGGEEGARSRVLWGEHQQLHELMCPMANPDQG